MHSEMFQKVPLYLEVSPLPWAASVLFVFKNEIFNHALSLFNAIFSG